MKKSVPLIDELGHFAVHLCHCRTLLFVDTASEERDCRGHVDDDLALRGVVLASVLSMEVEEILSNGVDFAGSKTNNGDRTLRRMGR